MVSLLTDASSEMIYPLLPAFLTGTLRAGPAFLGVMEGLAEALAAFVKVASGAFSDRVARRKPAVMVGYGLSSLVRPLVALATAPVHVLAVRLLDRLGKGVRSAPRDALLAEVTAADQRGRAYGFHRAMDHAGAVAGPLLSSTALLFTHDIRLVFALAAIPAALAMAALAFGVQEERGVANHPSAADRPGLGEKLAAPDRSFRRYLLVLAVFTLGNSSDTFLLLRAQQVGVSLTWVPLLWSFHHLVKALASTAGGALSDRIGRRRAILGGWAVYGLTYGGFALARSPLHIFVLFAVYGLFHALTEGPERALVVDLTGSTERGRAFGLYHAVTGGVLLPASLLTGVLWQLHGAGAALGVGALLAGVAAAGLWQLVPEPVASGGPRTARA